MGAVPFENERPAMAMAADSPEGRRYRRLAVFLSGKFHRGKQVTDCYVQNLSPTGAGVKVSQPLHEGAIGTLSSERFGMIAAEVAWTDENSAGLRFLDDPAWIALLFSTALPTTRFELDTADDNPLASWS